MTGESILIVDDETNLVYLIRMSLEGEGYRAGTASSGIIAPAKVKAYQPAYMSLDIMLPCFYSKSNSSKGYTFG